MTYYLLPISLNRQVYSKLQIEFSNTPPHCEINDTLYKYLCQIKLEITDSSSWDIIKKYTNPYEYIHTCVHQDT